MANLDTAVKRGSALQAYHPWSTCEPFPTAFTSYEDRRWMGHSYSGLYGGVAEFMSWVRQTEKPVWLKPEIVSY